MNKSLRIIPFEGKWAIEEEGDVFIRIVHNSKYDAILEAKKLARIYNSELTLQDNDGSVHNIYL